MNYKKKTIKQIKYYHLVQEIGKGASAKVYLAVDDRKDELVAVKAIPMESLKKDRGMINLQREVKNLNKLKA